MHITGNHSKQPSFFVRHLAHFFSPRRAAQAIVLPVALTIATGCSVINLVYPSCGQRLGYCFEATANGAPIKKLGDSGILDPFKEAASSPAIKVDLDHTKWWIEKPLRGEISLETAVDEKGADWIGDNGTFETLIQPLDGQRIDSHVTLKKSNSVLINGQAVAKSQAVANSRTLPPGHYLFIVTVRGSKNWDRKTVFATVE